MHKKLRVLFVGDHIDDVYHFGHALGLANEDPVVKFQPHEMEVREGGVSLCARLFKSMASDICESIDIIRFSESSIYRHIDVKYKRNLFTIDQVDKLYTPEFNGALIKEIIDYKPNLIYVWGDGRSLLHHIDSTLCHLRQGGTIVASDGIDNTRYSHYVKDYVNMAGWPPDKEKKVTIYTCEEYVKINDWTEMKNPPQPNLVDTCGAGDTLFTTFITHMARIDNLRHPYSKNLKRAVRLGQAAAHIQIEHLGTYIPTWDEIEERHKELFSE